MSFKALLTRKTNDGVSTELVDFDEANLMDGDVLVQVENSTLNYKDEQDLTGERTVIRTYP
jgi:acrylyl-CoA reductase (NADPH)